MLAVVAAPNLTMRVISWPVTLRFSKLLAKHSLPTALTPASHGSICKLQSASLNKKFAAPELLAIAKLLPAILHQALGTAVAPLALTEAAAPGLLHIQAAVALLVHDGVLPAAHVVPPVVLLALGAVVGDDDKVLGPILREGHSPVLIVVRWVGIACWSRFNPVVVGQCPPYGLRFPFPPLHSLTPLPHNPSTPPLPVLYGSAISVRSGLAESEHWFHSISGIRAAASRRATSQCLRILIR